MPHILSVSVNRTYLTHLYHLHLYPELTTIPSDEKNIKYQF